MVARGRALLIARLMIGLYIVELLLNVARPKVLPDEPTVSIFYKLPKPIAQHMQQGPFASFDRLLSVPQTVFWAVMAGIVVGVLLQVAAAVLRPRGRRAAVLTWATLAALLGPFSLLALTVVASYPLTALACVPGTAFVLWLLHHGQRFARASLPVLLAAFGWGAFIVFGLGRAYTGLAYGTVYGYSVKNSRSLLDATSPKSLYRVIDLLVLHLSVVNALLVAAGVVVVLLLFRHQVVDTLTGLVLGAAVGLGYAFVESILFIRLYGTLSSITGASGGFEYWIRQSIGLLGGPVAYGALLGAGLGLAVRRKQRRERGLIAGAALIAVIGGAVSTETLSAWLSRLVADHMEVGAAFDTLVVSPFLWLLPQAPFIVLAVLLLLTGRRARASATREALSAEAAAGVAITPGEEAVLADPRLRFWALVSTWRRYGPSAALALRRLHTAQLELAGLRLHEPADPERADPLRTKVLRLKTRVREGAVMS
ncbi:PrsW family glutamic-type intramembrane protease [Streptomyces sp. NPDC057686]|uniref:PrsW family glutamic-type intramembrane protease n=1 Tax=Streptomyces sp. NPDC057686 TaxID=3346212 RepID=UPI00367C7706